MDGMNLKQSIGVGLVRAGQLFLPKNCGHFLTLGPNPFTADLYRLRKSGYKRIKRVNGFNDITVVGKNHLLDVTFGAGTALTQIDPWHIGLINQTPTPVLSENDTSASHAGWAELTAYAGTRKVWDDADSAAKVKGTTTTSDFTMNATNTIHGIMIDELTTGTTGILWATGSFDTALAVVNTDVVKITYGIRT